MQNNNPKNQKRKRCLITERHEWETGTGQRQLQFVLKEAASFFGSGNVNRKIRLRVFLSVNASKPSFEKDIIISQEYSNGTRRTNNFPEMGTIPSSFVFFQETEQTNVYDFWWQMDKAIIAARYQIGSRERILSTEGGDSRSLFRGQFPR